MCCHVGAPGAGKVRECFVKVDEYHALTPSVYTLHLSIGLITSYVPFIVVCHIVVPSTLVCSLHISFIGNRTLGLGKVECASGGSLILSNSVMS